MGRVKDKVFTVNLHHDEIFIANPIKTVKRLYYCSIKSELKDRIKELKTDKYVEDFLRVGYENKWFVNLYTEHHDYDMLEFLTIEGEENIVIKNLSTQDPFLNKLCSNHGSFSGFIDEPLTVDQEPIDDPDAASIDPLYKVMRDVEAGRCAGMYSNKKYVAKKKLFADDSPRPVKKAIPVKKSVSFSPDITKRSLNSGEGYSKHGEGTSRDAKKSPQSPK
ncbi:hypothetical protein Tco_0654460 [Tanacetum coccineum]|uniref:Uncharacterized protein n=1 Tax=Tanacetum coccineum TaxID=301880 RepID=A0ABQ4X3C3_9ASTR